MFEIAAACCVERPIYSNVVDDSTFRCPAAHGLSEEDMTGLGFRSMASRPLHEQGWNHLPPPCGAWAIRKIDEPAMDFSSRLRRCSTNKVGIINHLPLPCGAWAIRERI